MFDCIRAISSPHRLAASFFAATFVISLVATDRIQRLAASRGWLRKPTSARHVHTQAIPRVGGVAIFGAVAGVLVAGLLGGSGPKSHHTMCLLGKLLMPGAMLFLMGLCDDFKPLPAKLKLAFQAGAGAWLYFLGYSVTGSSWASPHALPIKLLEVAATVVWVVWITNAVNLIDGLDGLATGSSVLSVATLFIAACLHGNHTVELGTALLGGAMLGFLRYNFNPASIFLGDGGSLFLGFMLSALGLVGSEHVKATLSIAVALPAFAVGLPLTEVVLSVGRRFLSGKRLFEPDRMHIHHRLLDRGLNHRQVVLVLYCVSAVFDGVALMLVHPTWSTLVTSFVVLSVLGVSGLIALRYPEFAEVARITRRTLHQRRIIANTIMMTRAVDELKQTSSVAGIRSALESVLPAGCFTELRFMLRRHTEVGSSHQMFADDAETGFTVKSTLSASDSQASTARVIVDVSAATLSGSLEFVVADNKRDLLFNLNQIVSMLQPALNGAIARLPIESLDTSSEVRDEAGTMPQPRLASVTVGPLAYIH